jgi:DNA repair photolyase
MKKPLSGTREWAQKSYNCVIGCSHNCRYCYARQKFIRNGGSASGWNIETPVLKKDGRDMRSSEKTVMFPTDHDITPANLKHCLTAIAGLLSGNDKLLIVSKPHYECVTEICKIFSEYGKKGKIVFRFTIGAFNDNILSYWEPGAPSFDERFRCLIHAHKAGFRTSVSCEPLLEPWSIDKMVHCFRDYVTDSIWIGKMNKVEERVEVEEERDKDIIETLKKWQTDEVVRSIYEKFKDDPKIYWKESYASVLNLGERLSPE